MEEHDETEEAETISVATTRRILGIGLNETYRAIHRGEIPAIKIGGSYRVLKKPLEKMLGNDAA
ncbi:hypothetical protein BLJAPNOD_02984 [Ensifer sp. M14]|uniref:helix-turn-helix domain-containing protein n=1 Tax=Ensifer sp. M14 TaxID=2203782 RepID=UPI000E1D6824|nr:helix-turn-helix domain-containing protein [Ensifer sp. M14]RDL51838.1 hypothetical protein BLJAPNOD_02984 [Ensifer sp. M14]